MKNYSNGLIALVALGLSACGGGGGGSSAPTAPAGPSTFAIGANFTKGPVDGAACELFEINSAGAKSTSIATGTTANGSVNFASVSYTGNALIECTGGTYTDEATGNTLTAPLMRAVVSVSGAADFTVSPLTEIAVQLAASNLNTVDNAAVASDFGLAGVNITNVTPDDLNAVIAGNDDAGKYGSVLALVSQVHATAGGGLDALLGSLAGDLGDGSFSASSLSQLSRAIEALAASTVAANLNSTVLGGIESAAGIPSSQAPTVSLTASASSVVSNGLVTLTVVSADDVAVVSEALVCNGGVVTLVGGSGDFTAPEVDTVTQVTCTATATDAAGNEAEASATITVNPPLASNQVVAKNPLPALSGNDCPGDNADPNPQFQLANDFGGLETPCFVEVELTNKSDPQQGKVKVYGLHTVGSPSAFGRVAVVVAFAEGGIVEVGEIYSFDEGAAGSGIISFGMKMTIDTNGCQVTESEITDFSPLGGDNVGRMLSTMTVCDSGTTWTLVSL